MNWVGQKHARGCGVAVLSMLTGRDYDLVAATWCPHLDLEKQGLYLRGLDDYLTDHGYAVARKSRFYGMFSEGGAILREPWPPNPFADVHVCEVEVYECAPTFHFVVMLRAGVCLDPLTPTPRRLGDYYRVNSVTGVYRVALPEDDCP